MNLFSQSVHTNIGAYIFFCIYHYGTHKNQNWCMFLVSTVLGAFTIKCSVCTVSQSFSPSKITVLYLNKGKWLHWCRKCLEKCWWYILWREMKHNCRHLISYGEELFWNTKNFRMEKMKRPCLWKMLMVCWHLRRIEQQTAELIVEYKMMINNKTGSVIQKYHGTNFQCLCIVTRIWAGLYSVQIPAGARVFSVLKNV